MSSPHAVGGMDTGRIMQRVILACLPGLLALTWFFGWGSLLNVLWLSALALGLEATIVWGRGRDPLPCLRDYSALVTAVLLGLSLPPAAPWWLGLIGIVFAIGVAKQLYGGLGYNPFNPAMVGYVVLLISFPLEMSSWVLPSAPGAIDRPDLLDSLSRMFPLLGDRAAGADAWTGATLLDVFRQDRGAMLVSEFRDQSPLFGTLSGRGWEWVNLGFLAGGLWLLRQRIIAWHIPVGMLGMLALLSALFWQGGGSDSLGSPLYHLFGGATMLGAFFIATDPVSAATTPRGRLLYGALIGAVVFVIRAWGNYPDGVAFAVLLGNFATPFIDLCTPPRTIGHGKGKAP